MPLTTCVCVCVCVCVWCVSVDLYGGEQTAISVSIGSEEELKRKQKVLTVVCIITCIDSVYSTHPLKSFVYQRHAEYFTTQTIVEGVYVHFLRITDSS